MIHMFSLSTVHFTMSEEIQSSLFIEFYAKYSGTDVKYENVEYKILSIKDALAIIE